MTLPNALFVNTAVVNETYNRSYVLHTFCVPLAAEVDWEAAEAIVRRTAESACADYIDAARESMTEVSARYGMAPPTVDPRVLLQLPETGKTQLLVRVPAPSLDKAAIEQHVLRDYLAWERDTLQSASSSPES